MTEDDIRKDERIKVLREIAAEFTDRREYLYSLAVAFDDPKVNREKIALHLRMRDDHVEEFATPPPR